MINTFLTGTLNRLIKPFKSYRRSISLFNAVGSQNPEKNDAGSAISSSLLAYSHKSSSQMIDYI